MTIIVLTDEEIKFLKDVLTESISVKGKNILSKLDKSKHIYEDGKEL